VIESLLETVACDLCGYTNELIENRSAYRQMRQPVRQHGIAKINFKISRIKWTTQTANEWQCESVDTLLSRLILMN
jgi:hypothetical protein